MPIHVRRSLPPACGFSLVDLLLTVAVLATISAIAVPVVKNLYDGQRLATSTRLVERELQTARLTAVAAGQPIRVRFNCPAIGQFRRVELIGTASVPATDDSDARAIARCAYPYPSVAQNTLLRPNHDGPIQRLDPAVSFTTVKTLEFWPNGTVHVADAANPWPQADVTSGQEITLSRGSSTKKIKVNGLGKIQIQSP